MELDTVSLFVHPSSFTSFHPFINLSVRQSIITPSSVSASIHFNSCPSICPSINLLVNSFVHQSIIARLQYQKCTHLFYSTNTNRSVPYAPLLVIKKKATATKPRASSIFFLMRPPIMMLLQRSAMAEISTRICSCLDSSSKVSNNLSHYCWTQPATQLEHLCQLRQTPHCANLLVLYIAIGEF